MREVLSLIKKELFDVFANKKIIILLIIYLGWGVMCPIFAKMTPYVLEMYATDGMIISMEEPTSIDAWYQFFKDGPYICVIILLVAFANVFSKEVETGTIINVLTKGIDRDKFLVSKYIIVLLTWIFGITICVVSCDIYTNVLFSDNLNVNYFVTLISPMIFGFFIISVMMFAQVLTCNYIGTLGIVALVWGGLILGNIFKPIQKYNPIALAQNNIEYIIEDTLMPDAIWQIIISVFLTVLFFYAAIIIFRKKQL